MPSVTEYLNKIGLEAEAGTQATLELLQKIAAKHVLSFRYQNTELFLQGKKPISSRVVSELSIEYLFEQLVIQNKSSYCFQSTELLAWVLERLGFNLMRQLAIVINKNTTLVGDEKVKAEPYAHEVLLIKIGEEFWLIDPAFANNSLRAPLKLVPGEQSIADEQYRLQNIDGYWRLESMTKDGWLSLYQFDANPKSFVEITEAHKALFLIPQPIPIRDTLLKFSLVTSNKRKVLAAFSDGRMAFFKSYKNGEICREKPLNSAEEFKEQALKKFANNLASDVLEHCRF